MARLNKSTRAAKAAKETGIFSLRSSICSIEMNPLRRAASTLPAALCLLPSAFCFLLVPLRQLLCGLLPYKVGPMAPQTAPSPPLSSAPLLFLALSAAARLDCDAILWAFIWYLGQFWLVCAMRLCSGSSTCGFT